MNSDHLKLSRRIQNLVPLPVMLTLALLILVHAPAGAASFAGTQTGPTEWTYTLTFDPLDNYAVCPPPGDVATITLSGLAGVVSATRPTSTDFPASLDSVNLQWIPQVSNGGTVVTLTHQGPGTGNFDIPKHAFGFKVITGAPAVNGTVNVASDGFSRDVSASGPCPVQPADDRDFTGTTNGPVGSPPPPPPDLALSVRDTPDPLTVNGQLTYTITVRNNGPGTATGVQVVDSLPSGATVFGPASSSQGECGGITTVVCDLGTLAAGAQATVTINVIPTATGGLSNTASVAAFETDPNPANNNSTETTTVQPADPARADLSITAAVAADPRAGGQGFTYSLTVRNGGPATATGVQLTDDLPQGIALGQITPSQGSCGGTDPVLCALGTLTSGTAATVTIDVIRTEVMTFPNRAAVNGDQFDPNSGNNFALTSAIDVPTPQTTCNSKRCRLRLTCNLSDLLGRICDNQVTLFVNTRARRDTRARRLSDERAARPPRLVRFAAAIRSFPGGQTENVPLKLTSKGKQVARTLIRQGKKKLRGEMRISNAASGIDIIPLTVRLK